MAQSKPTVPIEKISGGRDFGSPSQALKAAGAEASKIKKVQKQEIGKPLSKAMQQWVQANRSKIGKNATAKQEAIFKKYDQMKEAGTLSKKAAPKKPAVKTKPAPQKPAAKKPKKAPRGYTPGKVYGEDVKPKKAPRGYTPGKLYGEDVKPSKSKAAQQPKAAKPKTRRSPGGRAQVKRGGMAKLRKSLGKLSDAFKLTRKAGEVFTVGNMKYVSDGKGGIRSSQRFR